MAAEHSIRRYRNWYARLLRLYPKPHRERFGEAMQQTFNDLLRDRAEAGKGLFAYACWLSVDTSAGIIRENITMIATQKRDILSLILSVMLGATLLLLIPLVAMQFTREVTWTMSDFVVAWILLVGTGLTYKLVARRMSNLTYRGAVALAVGSTLLLIWSNLAVGLIGSENNPANLMYLSVLAVAIIGAILARLEPRGMARAMFATALALASVAVIALLAGVQHQPGISAGEIVGVNAIFVTLFIASALLFLRATATARPAETAA
jgi:hypothetical protein